MNRDVIKYMTIVAMTFNHIAYILLTPGTMIHEVFEDIGYFTAITMCYFLVEGYHYTRSKKKYAKRLFIFALISQIPYYLAVKHFQLNMMFTLLACFLIVWVMEEVKEEAKRKRAISGLIVFTLFCDWAVVAALFTILLQRRRNDKKGILTAYGVSASLFWILSLPAYLEQYSTGIAMLHAAFSVLGIALSCIMILIFYNGKKSEKHTRFNRWFFYIYYPAHLLVLVAIKAFW
ncbi:MAG: hypothetical protein E7256_08175 [Lachnospiraceae bacterium]|nr:hypothetical protein [Lachnospiraceae bacterium]